MIDYFAQVGFGVTLFLFGLRIYVSPRWYAVFKDTYLDFSDHNRFWGSVCMVVGAAFVALTVWLRTKSKRKSEKLGDRKTDQ